MGSILQQWESDPLFSAAEVIQDSADRMESIYRLLLHEQSLGQGDHSDPRLLSSIEFYRRDLATILETAKWQLEDFERAVKVSAMMDNSRTRENVVFRHNQFIKAIKEQIYQVEKSLGDQHMGNSIKNSDWVNLNQQDRDGFALFLSGGNPTEAVNHINSDDDNVLYRFLDPTSTSGLKDGGVVGHGTGEIEELDTNSAPNVENYYDSKRENNMRKVGSHYLTQTGFDAVDSSQEASSTRNHLEDSSWDLEACEGNAKRFFHDNKSKGYYSRMDFFRFPKNLLTAFGSKAAGSYTKRLKDGDEQEHAQLFNGVSYAPQGQHGEKNLTSTNRSLGGFYSGFFSKLMHLCTRLQSSNASSYRVQLSQRSMQIILSAVFSLVILGLLVLEFAG